MKWNPASKQWIRDASNICGHVIYSSGPTEKQGDRGRNRWYASAIYLCIRFTLTPMKELGIRRSSRPRRMPLLADADIETPEKKTPRKCQIHDPKLSPVKRQRK
jgi:hypothetical protein